MECDVRGCVECDVEDECVEGNGGGCVSVWRVMGEDV